MTFNEVNDVKRNQAVVHIYDNFCTHCVNYQSNYFISYTILCCVVIGVIYINVLCVVFD